jgi:hypothetical protein
MLVVVPLWVQHQRTVLKSKVKIIGTAKEKVGVRIGKCNTSDELGKVV